MLSADPERAERHDGLLTSGGRSRGGILALCWVTPTPARRQHAAVSHEQSAQIYVYISKSLHLGACPLPGVYLVARLPFFLSRLTIAKWTSDSIDDHDPPTRIAYGWHVRGVRGC